VRTLWRHYSTQFLRSFAGSLLILALIVLVVDMLLNMSDLLEAEKSVGAALKLFLMRTGANYLTYLIPVAAFTGAFASLSSAARTHEVVAIKAGGISPIVAFLPILVLSVGLAAGAFALNETVGVRSAAQLAERAGFSSEAITLRGGAIWVHAGRLIYSATDTDPSDDWIHDVQVFERDEDGLLIRVIHAEAARRLSDAEWEFEGATIRSFTPGRASDPPRVERAALTRLQLESPRNLRLDPKELASLGLPTLFDYVGAVLAAGGNPGPARSALHNRLTVPFLVILFTLLAVPLALSVEQSRSLARPALQGVAILFLLLLARESGQGLVVNTNHAAALLPWTVLAIFFFWGAYRLQRVPR
jgi:lipopolysaccharide export system permease protein